MNFVISIILVAMLALCGALFLVEDSSKRQTARVFVPVAPEAMATN